MIQLGIGDKNYPLKSKWNELSKEDLLEICRIRLLPTDEPTMRIMILKYLMGTDYDVLETANPLALPEVMDLLNYIFGNSHLTVNHFPEVGNMMGPEPGLTNFTFEQFFNKSEPYCYLIGQNKPDALDNLLCVMYNYNGPDENDNIIKELPEVNKLAIFFYYQGCANFIKHKFRSVFEQNGKKSAPDGLEFLRLVNSLNENDMSKNELIKKTNLYEALSLMEKLINA